MPTSSDGFFPALLSPLLVGGLLLPLCRLMLSMAVSLVIAQALETFGWTRYIAKLATPLVRTAHLTSFSGAAFSLSFASPAAANAILAEGMARSTLSKKELVLANVINSTPAFLIHLPTLAATAWAFLGRHAISYVGLILAAALLRTAGAVLIARMTLPQPKIMQSPSPAPATGTFASLLKRFKKRLAKMFLFTIPVYCLVFALQQAGTFKVVESFLVEHTGALFFLHPASLGIVILFVAAESNAAFAAAAALLHGGTASPEQVVMALLIGNILSSPMRAFRHQLPSYAGYFTPSNALLLVGINQSLRAATLALAATGFYTVHVL